MRAGFFLMGEMLLILPVGVSFAARNGEMRARSSQVTAHT